MSFACWPIRGSGFQLAQARVRAFSLLQVFCILFGDFTLERFVLLTQLVERQLPGLKKMRLDLLQSGMEVFWKTHVQPIREENPEPFRLVKGRNLAPRCGPPRPGA